MTSPIRKRTVTTRQAAVLLRPIRARNAEQERLDAEDRATRDLTATEIQAATLLGYPKAWDKDENLGDANG